MSADSVNDSQALPEGLLPDDFHIVSAVVYGIFVHVRHTGRNKYLSEIPALLHGIGLDSFRSFRENYLLYVLQMVDEKQIAFRPAVEISYLAEEQQYTLLEAMSYNDATPSLAQAIKMKKFNQDGKLTDEVIQSIMEEEKPNQKEKPVFRDERITKLIPKTVPKGQETDFVVKALEFYNRHLQRNKAHER